ncbi:DnaA/Hda family protein [uncultured Desulfovibrio sp.]|uniref:helix-turn-helix domain-containing protein n=1 Tax=uncultured Desulfovibrio sp. TaxID=167968 RepID=UPI0003A87D4C|nr:DnaA/Hda family protein [uncultured Desulfovibrio sp.]
MLKNELRHILSQDGGQETWFEGLTLHQENDTLRVVFPHTYFAVWFSRHKRGTFEAAIHRHFTDKVQPRVVYEQGGATPHPAAPEALHDSALPERGEKSGTVHGTDGGNTPDACNAEDSFAAFISNAKNAFPLAAAKKIAASAIGEAYNPFLLCGRSGTGKTHLLRALAATFTRRNARVICQNAARFCAENTLWKRRPELLWEQCDALMLDDMQDLADQRIWQQQLIACMDACPCGDRSFTGYMDHGGGPRQMIFAHAGPAQALKYLDERLRSRLESGLVVELLEPDLDVRLRYLQTLGKERRLNLGREQLLYLAQRCAQFRLLQGLLLKVEAFAAVHGRNLTPTDLENIVRTGGAERPPGCREILNEVARGLNLRPEDILGTRRRPDLVLARQVAMYLCRQKLGLSYPELGRAFGGRDHSTVIHAIKKIKKLLISDKNVQRLVAQLETTAL